MPLPIFSIPFIDIMGCPVWAWLLSTTSALFLFHMDALINLIKKKLNNNKKRT
jgi:hypothetical protein